MQVPLLLMGTSARLSTTILAMRGLHALRKAWEISDKIKIQNVAFFDRQDIEDGRRSNLEAEWQRVVDILQ